MHEKLSALFHRHVAAAFDQQQRLAELLEAEAPGTDWAYTTSTATLLFGDHLQFEAHDLGSHAEPDNSWLWTWCNPHLSLTPENRKLADEVRQLGQKNHISAFSADRQFSCEELLGSDLCPESAHVLASIIVGELGYDAYYTMPFSHGRYVAVIRDERLRVAAPIPVARILLNFPKVLTAFAVLDHRAAFVAYAQWYHFTIEETPRMVIVYEAEKEVLKANFDSRNRLTKLSSAFGPEQ